MGCKFIIKTEGVELELSPSISNDSSSDSFITTIQGLDEKELYKIIDEINKVKNTSLDLSNINTANVIGTIDFDELAKQNTYGLDTANEEDKDFSQLANFIIAKLPKENRPNILITNISNYKNSTRFDKDSRSIIMDLGDIKEYRFTSRLKSIIDYYVDELINSGQITDEHFKGTLSRQTLSDRLYNLPNSFNFSKPADNEFIKRLSLLLSTDESQVDSIAEILKKLYELHDLVATKDVDVQGVHNLESLNVYIDNIVEKFGKLNKKTKFEDLRDYYYNPAESHSKIPTLKPGDLIKFKNKEGSEKFGVDGFWGMYINDYIKKSDNLNENVKVYHIIQLTSEGKKNKHYRLTEDQLNFSENGSKKFITRTNIKDTPTTSPRLNKATDFNVEYLDDPFIFNAEEVETPSGAIKFVWDKSSLKSLKEGDLFKFHLKENKMGVFARVKEVKGNIIYYTTKNATSLKKTSIHNTGIESIFLNKATHNELVTLAAELQSGELRDTAYWRENSKYLPKAIERGNPNFEANLGEVSMGDLIVHKIGGKSYTNYVVNVKGGKFEVIDGNGDKHNVEKENVIKINFNLKKYSDVIDKFSTEFNAISKYLKEVQVDVEIKSKQYNAYDVSIPSNFTDLLKSNIKTEDIVEIDGDPFIVLDVDGSKLKVYNFNEKNAVLQVVEKSEVSAIIKTNPDILPHSEYTTVYNEKLRGNADTLQNLLNRLSNGNMVGLKYMMKKSDIKEYGIN